MNRTDRLLALVLELRLGGEIRAEDLARTFSTSKRTIYRDIQALCEAGVPVVSLMGQGYKLAEGYFLPPLAFTEDEAILALLGLSATAESFDTEYRVKAEDARRKILGVLSDSTRQRVKGLEQGLLLTSTQGHSPEEQTILRRLRRAILESQRVQFRYFSRHPGDGKVSLRQVDPYALVLLDGVWYLNGHCHAQQDRRLFRLSRMESLTILNQRFQRLDNFVLRDESKRDNRHVRVRVLLDEDVVPWINEDRFFYIDQREPHPDGVMVTLRVRHIDEIMQWVLGWGRHVRVIEPSDLIQRLRDEADAMFKNHHLSD